MAYRQAFKVVVIAFNGKVFGVDPDSGARHWSFDSGHATTLRLAIGDDRVYCCGLRCGLTCLDLESGKVQWRNADAKGETLLLAGNRILVGEQGEVRGFSVVDGTKLWEDQFKGMGIGEVAMGIPGHVVQADVRG